MNVLFEFILESMIREIRMNLFITDSTVASVPNLLARFVDSYDRHLLSLRIKVRTDLQKIDESPVHSRDVMI